MAEEEKKKKNKEKKERKKERKHSNKRPREPDHALIAENVMTPSERVGETMPNNNNNNLLN